jgi:hypothetical protein
MKRLLFVLLLCSISGGFALAQTRTIKPVVRQALYFDVTPPLKQMPQLQPAQGGRTTKEVPNKIGHRAFNRLTTNAFPFAEDGMWQKQDGTYMPAAVTPLQNFEGINNISGVYPPDTQGDVGPNHYIQVVNLNYAIYSKTGTLLLGPAALSTIWAGIPSPWNGTNNGDPIVLYDQAADRWIITQFSLPTGNYAELVAISQTSDPTGAWYRYVFQYGTNMPDYPKFGIWPDGYYMSANQFLNASTWAGVGATAMDRTKMLAGDPTATMVYFDLGAASDPGGMIPSDWDGSITPMAGEPNYFIYFNDWTSATDDYLKIWEFDVDWVTPANSTFTETTSLITSPFDSELCTATRGRCVPQPGTTVKLESLSDRLMYRVQYRNFNTHRSMVTNHTVDVDGTGRAGIRWYELRNTGAGWSIYQQGTYSPDANNRWMGSVAMNTHGDIALGYSVSNATDVYPSIRYTGRLANDPLGQMTLAEQTIIAGSGYQSGSSARWGDYSMMSVDPVDDLTFWYTTEYIQTSGSTPWQTRIASFKFDNSPTVITQAATSVTATSATLNGTVNPNSLATNWYFQWGTTTSYGNVTPVTSAGSGINSVAVNASISGLTGGIPIHFRLVGVNSDGTTNGADMTFIPGAASVTTTAASSIGSYTAVSGGNVTADGGSAVTARGVCWSTSVNPTIVDNHTTDGSGTGTFTSNLTGLSANTTYHVRAYATNSFGTFYGADVVFTTLCGISTLPFNELFAGTTIPLCWSQQASGTGAVNSWTVSLTSNAGGTANEMKSTYQSVSPGVARLVTPPINTTGFGQLNLSFRHMLDTYSSGGLTLMVQSSTDGVTWTNESWSVLTGSSNITATLVNTTIINNLNSPSTYIGFAISGNLYNYDYWYIDNVSVSGVSSDLPVVTTTTVSSITMTTAASGGNVTLAGSSPVTARGVCWGTTADPTIAGNHTTDGSGTGAFTSLMAGLSGSTVYHVRAYATNNSGTSYGSDIQFSTACGIVNTYPWTEGFENGGLIPTCWTQEQVNSSGINWTFITGSGNGNPAAAHTGTYNACLKDVTSADNKTRLITPTLNLASLPSPQLKFWRTQANWGGDQDYLTVYYKTASNGTWMVLASYTNNVTTWTQETLLLPFASSDYYIAFEGNARYGYGVCVDDVEVSSSCATILPVSVTITASANPVMAGTSVYFEASPVNGGFAPVYDWKVNGVSTGYAELSFTYEPMNNDIVTCLLNSSDVCVSGNPATSNAIVMEVNTVPSNLILQNIIISLGTDTCFNSVDSITVAGDNTTFTVQNGGSATLIAGQKILCLPGTTVLEGGYFHAYITETGQFCNTLPPPVVAAALTGTGENGMVSGSMFSVYPNPTTGEFNLIINGYSGEGSILAELFNSSGKLIRTVSLKGNGTHSMSLADEPSGIYLIRMTYGEKTESVRIVRQ